MFTVDTFRLTNSIVLIFERLVRNWVRFHIPLRKINRMVRTYLERMTKVITCSVKPGISMRMESGTSRPEIRGNLLWVL